MRFWAGFILVTGAAAQPAPSFEVASIKPTAVEGAARMSSTMSTDRGRISFINVSLKNVVTSAYKVKRMQVVGPDWLDSLHFDIQAKLPEGTTGDQTNAMLQTMLAERFKMKIHRETREQAGYALVVGKNGPKLKKSETENSGSTARSTGGGRLELRNVTVAGLCSFLTSRLDRIVRDETGVEGRFDLDFDLGSMGSRPAAAAASEPAPAPDASAPASVFTVVQQLGLRLEPRKAPVEYIIVDSTDKVPTEN